MRNWRSFPRGGSESFPCPSFIPESGKTILAPDEVIKDIRFDALKADQSSFFIKTALRKAQAISVINVSVVLALDGERVQDAQITLGAAAPTIIHAQEAERFMLGKALNAEVIGEAASLTAGAAHPISDIRGSADYRDYIIGVITKRTLTAIWQGVDKEIIPSNPILLMGDGMQAKPLTVPWTGEEIHTTINGKEYHFKTGFNKTLLNLIRDEAGIGQGQRRAAPKVNAAPVRSFLTAER